MQQISLDDFLKFQISNSAAHGEKIISISELIETARGGDAKAIERNVN